MGVSGLSTPGRGCNVGEDTSMWLRETNADSADAAADPTRLRSVLLNRPERRTLRVLVHDFAGHPFQIDLSRALARRGHTVRHVYCGSYTSGKGRLHAGNTDNLSVMRL